MKAMLNETLHQVTEVSGAETSRGVKLRVESVGCLLQFVNAAFTLDPSSWAQL